MAQQWRKRLGSMAAVLISGSLAGAVLWAQDAVPAGGQTPPAPASSAAPAARTSPGKADLNAVPTVQDIPGLRRRSDDDIATISASAHLVVVDVVVTDAAGRAVRGLKASDFVLNEDGKPQTIASFTEHDRMSPAAAAAEAARLKLPPNTFSNYGPLKDTGSIVFLIDALDTQVQDQMRLRQDMITFLKTVQPGTPMAVFQLDTQMKMIQGFTTDPAEVLAAVQSKRDSPGFSPLLQPAIVGDGIGDRLKGEGGGGAEQKEFQKEQRSRILNTGMSALGKYLSGFPGRKSLVWFTADVPVSLFGMTNIGGPLADQSSFLDDLTKTTSVLTLNQVAVYPVDTRGLSTHFGVEQTIQHQALDQVAEATGGHAFYNTNGLKEAMAEVADTATNYYTISYSPTNKQYDGRYRTLKLDLDRKGDTLEYRQGYYSRNDDAELAQHKAMRKAAAANGSGALTLSAVGGLPATSIDKAMPLGAPEKQDVLFFAQLTAPAQTLKASAASPLAKDNYLAAAYRKGAYREYKVHYAVKGTSLDLVPTGGGNYHGRVEFVTVVYDDKGMPVNSKIVKTSIDATPFNYGNILEDGIETALTIAVPAKGDFFLRLGVHDATSDKTGTLEVPVGEIKVGVQVGAAAVPKP